MLKKKNLPTYPDGVVAIYRDRQLRTSFGGKENPASTDAMDLVARLAFSEESKRERDFEFAEQRGFNLSMKIRTHSAPGVDSGCKALIGSSLFDVSYIDQTKTEMYLYLEGGYEFGGDTGSDQ